jgi:PTS system nitrogen regulatory IIA component
MKISDFLSSADILLDVRAKDKSRLLRELSLHAAAEVGLNADEVSEQITKREGLGSTGVGNGVALPHARLRGLKESFGLLARLRQGIDFAAIDDLPVDIVFLLLLPEAANGQQLNALAAAARALRDPEALRRIRGATDREALFQAVTDSDQTQGGIKTS